MVKIVRSWGTFGSWDVEKVHSAVARSTFRIQNVESTWKHNIFGYYRSTFGSWADQKVHARVTQSTFGSQNAENTACSEHFWQWRCWKSARCCVKHIWKSKCSKHNVFGALVAVEMLNECTTFGAKHMWKSKCESTPGSGHFWQIRCRKNARCCGAKHIWKSKCQKQDMFRPLSEVPMSKKCTPLCREAHCEVRMRKAPHILTAFGSWEVEKKTPLRRQAHLEVKSVTNLRVRSTCGRWELRCGKSARRRCGAKICAKLKSGRSPSPFLWQALWILHLYESELNLWVLVTVSESMAGVGRWKRIWKDAFQCKRHLHQRYSEDCGGLGADFLRGVAFWDLDSLSMAMRRDRKIARRIGTRPSALHLINLPV